MMTEHCGNFRRRGLKRMCSAGTLLLVCSLVSLSPQAGLGQGVSPVTGVTIFNGGSFVDFSNIFRRSSGLRIDGATVNDPLNRKAFGYTAPVTFGYAFAYNWQFMVNAPLVYRETSFDPATGISRAEQNNTGLGDVSLLVKYRFFKRDQVDPGRRSTSTQMAVTAGPKLPTGGTDARDQEGNPLPPPLQAGSGSTDIFTAVGLSHSVGDPQSDPWSLKRWQINASATYLARTEGARDVSGVVWRRSGPLQGGSIPWRET